MISNKIIINSDSINTSVAGTYRVHYDVTDSSGNNANKIRPVFVGVNPDSTPPDITLIGSNPMYLAVGDPYNEPGATAVDDFDGDVSGNIVINSDSVNTAVQGTYRVHYTVSDNAGNSAHEIRRVIVGATGDTVIVKQKSSYSVNFPIHRFNAMKVSPYTHIGFFLPLVTFGIICLCSFE